jgi:hypothetical protein
MGQPNPKERRMARKMQRKVAAGAVALVAVAGGGAAVAATQLSSKEESQTVLKDAAAQLGVKPSELSAAIKSALENRVDAAVAAGRITKSQGDELKQRIDSNDFPLFGFGGPRGFERHGHFHGLDAAAAYLGVTEEELHSQLESGKSLADVAEAQGKSVDGLVDAMVADAKKHLDEEVAEGDITRAQADRMLSNLKDRITDLVNGRLPEPGARPGFGFRHDFDRPPSFDGAAA